MRTQTVKDYIKDHQALFWYSPGDKSETVSDELLVETILNYGKLEDVRQLFKIMGLQNVADIFFNVINRSERSKNNYHELTSNYFTLLFNRYVHKDINYSETVEFLPGYEVGEEEVKTFLIDKALIQI